MLLGLFALTLAHLFPRQVNGDLTGAATLTVTSSSINSAPSGSFTQLGPLAGANTWSCVVWSGFNNPGSTLVFDTSFDGQTWFPAGGAMKLQSSSTLSSVTSVAGGQGPMVVRGGMCGSGFFRVRATNLLGGDLPQVQVMETDSQSVTQIFALPSLAVQDQSLLSFLQTGPVPVSGTFWQATQPISASTLPLPTGASTSALQQSMLTLLGGGLPSTLDTGNLRVNVENFPSSQAVTAASLPLPSGAATSANQTSMQTTLSSILSVLQSPVPPSYSYKNFSANTVGTLVDANPGVIGEVDVLTPGTVSTAAFYDGTSTAGTPIGTISTLVGGPYSSLHGLKFNTALYVVIAGVTPANITVLYK